MSWLGRLFGTEKAINSLVDKDNGLLSQVGGWVGNFNYTDEEKAEADAKTREWGLKQLEALQPFKVVQRILASVIISIWAIVIINLLFAFWLQHPSSEKILELAFSDLVFWPTLSVVSLYFGGGAVESWFRGRKGD